MRTALLVLVVLSGLFTAFLSRASSPDYHRLFWNILPYAGVHVVSAGIYLLAVRHWTRWAVLVLTVVALASFGELAVRVGL